MLVQHGPQIFSIVWKFPACSLWKFHVEDPGHQGHDSNYSELKEGDEVSETDDVWRHNVPYSSSGTDQAHTRVPHCCRKYFPAVDVNNCVTGGEAQFAKESKRLDDSRSEGGQELDTQTSQASSNHGYTESGPPTSHAQQPVGDDRRKEEVPGDQYCQDQYCQVLSF